MSQKRHNRVAKRVQHVAANNTAICCSQLTFRKRVITFSFFYIYSTQVDRETATATFNTTLKYDVTQLRTLINKVLDVSFTFQT